MAHWENVSKLSDKRDTLYVDYDDSIEEFKTSKGGKAAVEQRKKIEGELKQIRNDLENLATKVKSENVEIAEKVKKKCT
jgi:ElaB/YqjD/DUF883 family membrane-anchored ribosome-binding protein